MFLCSYNTYRDIERICDQTVDVRMYNTYMET